MFFLPLIPVDAYVYDLTRAISSVTDDVHERALLTNIVAHESGFREDIGRCQVLGDSGRAYGAFQVWPRSMAERLMTCASLEGAAALALERVRESLRVCRYQPDRWKLGIFTSGSCTNAGGRKASERRWVSNSDQK